MHYTDLSNEEPTMLQISLTYSLSLASAHPETAIFEEPT